MRRLLVPLVIAVLALSACSSEGDNQIEASASPQALPADVVESLTTQLTKTMSANDVPGAAVQVCIPGYSKTTIVEGVADTETAEPMTEGLVWPIRSVTKSFTVTLILQLVDEGKISLDDTIDQWVPGVPNGDEITLRQLADMSSGVPEYTTQAWLEDYIADPTREFTTQELIEYAIAEPAQFPPGSKKVYVNTSTLLLGEVVSQEYGQPFDQVVSEQILQPLDLGNTTYVTSADGWSGPHPTGYQPDADGMLEAQDNNFTVFGPAGAMTSTLNDLCAWGSALGSGELLDPATQQARIEGTPLDKGPEYDVYGQGIGALEGWVGHTGEGLGHTILVMHNPTSEATAVVAMNISSTGKHIPTRYFRKIAPVLDQVTSQGS